LNGVTTKGGQLYMWLAKRAESKHHDPGKWDNIAAGRIARGFTPLTTLAKESFEEAGINAELIAHARSAGAVRSKREVQEGFHHEIIFAHDLILPEDFVPQNQDGEVEAFECVPLVELLARLEQPAQFSVDSALVIVDCLLRRGYIHSDREDYLDLIHAMRP